MSMIDAAKKAWAGWHTGHGFDHDVPAMNPSFWKGFKAGAEYAESQYGPATEEPEEEA